MLESTKRMAMEWWKCKTKVKGKRKKPREGEQREIDR